MVTKCICGWDAVKSIYVKDKLVLFISVPADVDLSSIFLILDRGFVWHKKYRLCWPVSFGVCRSSVRVVLDLDGR